MKQFLKLDDDFAATSSLVVATSFLLIESDHPPSQLRRGNTTYVHSSVKHHL